MSRPRKMDGPAPRSGRYDYRIRSYELGTGERASLASLCHLLQDAASLHAHELRASPEQLLAQGMTWFLARMRLVIEDYPGWREVVSVETWPAAVAAPFAIRDFRVTGRSGGAVAAASTSWLLMDMAKRRPIRRMPREVVGLHPQEPIRVFPHEPRRLPRLETAENEVAVSVRGSDLDINGHVNHVFYIDQIEHAVSRGLGEARRIAELEIDFKVECHEGDELAVRSSSLADDDAGGDAAYLHSVLRYRDSQEVVRARTRSARGPRASVQ